MQNTLIRLSKIVTTLLVSLMLLCLMKNSILYAVYGFDREVFIELFCINKNRPDLHCDGKCELSKLFREKQKENASRILVQLQLENQYFSPSFTFDFGVSGVISQPENAPAISPSDAYSFDFIEKNHKPPRVV